MRVAIDTNTVAAELERLSSFSDVPAPAVTRIVFSPVDLAARAWLKGLCSAAGLATREDSVGNMFARWPGSEPQLEPVATGSHIDAIPNSGRYDGTVGVLGALESIRALKSAHFLPRRSIELILFTSEEPTRFGIGCLGSRLLSGALSPDRAARLRDREGRSLNESRLAAGFNGDLSDVRIPASHYHAFIELHIEQGPLLERDGIAIGVVTHIAAPASLRVTVQGEGGHAGSLLMPERRDALVGAAEIITAVEAAARSTGAFDSVATTGVCQVSPGAVNSVPSLVQLEIDVRDTDRERRDEIVENIGDACTGISQRRGLQIATEVLNADAPAACSVEVVKAAIEASEALGESWVKLVSRAYHDSLFMSRIARTGMIFIPCRRGFSHRPDEYTSPENIASGIAVLAQTLAQLAR